MWSNRKTCHYHSLVKVSFLVCIHHLKTHCFYKFPAWQVFHPQISKSVEVLEHIFSACRQVPNYGLINHSSACTCLCKTSSFLLCDPCRIWECMWQQLWKHPALFSSLLLVLLLFWPEQMISVLQEWGASSIADVSGETGMHLEAFFQELKRAKTWLH